MELEYINGFLIVVGLVILFVAFLLISFFLIGTQEGGLSLIKEHNEFMDDLIDDLIKKDKIKKPRNIIH